MSWDVSIIKLSRQYQSVSDIPKDEKPLPIGTKKEVHEAISKLFPNTDWSDPAWGMFKSKFGSIEFNIGNENPVESFMLHVRAGEEVVPAIVRLCLDNGWNGLDCSTGEFIEKSSDPESGLKAWVTYRDQVIGKNNDA
jgi:hypothetical protein